MDGLDSYGYAMNSLRKREGEVSEDETGSVPLFERCGLFSPRSPVTAIGFLGDDGIWHGVDYVSFQGEIRMNPETTQIEFVFESDAGVFRVTIEGRNLFSVFRYIKNHLIDILRIDGAMVTAIRVQKVEGEAD